MHEKYATFLGLGSNLPASYASSVDLLESAINAVAAARVRVIAASSFYRTRPLGPSQPDFVNLVLKVDTVLGARGLLHEMQRIEAAFGRAREVRWGPRTLDIDLLSMPTGGAGPDPLLPHGGMHHRGFVLYPLSEIAPGWRHPVSGLPIFQLIRGLPAAERAGITRLA
jgi:2-amino-4-hydroxy-6-hydroxymethyldihydropteridine diphosphokinase